MNIFLHEIGGETIVKVLDFGIAKSADTGLTRTGTTVGTPSYMSPEQVLNRTLDGRADLYALGVILYGCVTGMLPFTGDSSYVIMMKHVDDDPPDLRQRLRAPTSEGFLAVIERALAKQPDDRYDTAQEMREALEKAAARLEAGTVRIVPAAVGAPERFAVELTLAASTTTSLARRALLRDKRTWVGAGALVATVTAGFFALFGPTRSSRTPVPLLAEASASSGPGALLPARVAAPPMLPPSFPPDMPPPGPAPAPVPQPPVPAPVPPTPTTAGIADPAPVAPKPMRKGKARAHHGLARSHASRTAHAPTPFD
jgi:serine/threonine protein kinase